MHERAAARRDIMKTAGISAAALYLPRATCAQEHQQEMLLDQADDRIEKHRKSTIQLSVIGVDGTPLPPGTPVCIEQQQHAFLFGSKILKLNRPETAERDEADGRLYAELFNFATLPFYWWKYEAEKGVPNDARSDASVQFCQQHGITAKGHPLAWNYMDPSWISDDPATALQQQFERIEKCSERFKGRIDCWDVVNEAAIFDREKCTNQAPVLTKAIQQMGLGNYLREAFKIARKANPQATLIINDVRTGPSLEQRVLDELTDENGRPLYDAIGLQSHMHRTLWPAEKIWEICERLGKYGRPIHFAETTLVSGPESEQGWNSTAAGEILQAKRVEEFYRLLFSHPAVEAISWWDFSDAGAWKNAPAGLVRKDQTPKPAYEALKKLIHETWKTRMNTQISSDAPVPFRGFLGDYTVTAMLDGNKRAGTFKLDRSVKQARVVLSA